MRNQPQDITELEPVGSHTNEGSQFKMTLYLIPKGVRANWADGWATGGQLVLVASQPGLLPRHWIYDCPSDLPAIVRDRMPETLEKLMLKTA